MIDVLFITETWWKDHVQCTLFGCFQPVAKKNRSNGPRGGVVILSRVTCRFPAEEIELDGFDFAVVIALRLNESSIALIILVYLPFPSPYEVFVESMASLLETATFLFEQKYPSRIYSHSLCVLGDFNFPNTDWNLMNSNSSRENDYLQLFSDWGLRPLILYESTHRDGNTLDNILCGVNSYPLSLEIRKQNLLKDHYPIIFKIDENLSCPESILCEFSISKHHEILNFERNWMHFVFDSYPSPTNVNEFYNFLWTNLDCSFSKKRAKRIANPFYYTSHTMHYLNKLNTAKRKRVKNPTISNLKKVDILQRDFDNSAELDRLLFIDGARTSSLTDCFRLLNSLKSTSYPTVMKENSVSFTGGYQIANAFNTHLAKNYNHQVFQPVAVLSDDSVKLADILNSLNPFSIRKLILEMKDSSMTTADCFPPKLMKFCPEVFAEIFYPLFASILLTCVYPEIWKVAYVRPLHKEGPRNVISNYRPISLLPKISLIFERIIFCFLYTILHGKLHPQQFGFQSRKSSVLQLIDFIENIHRHKHSCTFAFYLDFEKAFDKVPHSILLSKLTGFGLDSDFISLLQSYLSGRIQHVKIENFISDAVYVVSGVPQGSVLGPLLFLLFINDLPSIFLDSIPWLFADDLKVLFMSLNFQNDLSRLWNWNIANGMVANLGKTKYLAIKGHPIVYFGSTQLKNVILQKDLGLYIANDLKWVSHVGIKLATARRAFYLLKSRIPFNTPSRTKLNLYRSMVFAILTYGISRLYRQFTLSTNW